jgi:DnaK suppressor protein
MVKNNKSKKIKKNRKRGDLFLIKYPAKLLKPVAHFLQERLSYLEKRKKTLEGEDPFNNEGRLVDNASPDADAEEQFGHARTSAIKEQLDRKIIQTRKALAMIKLGKYGICEDCGKMIDTDRLMVYPEATICANDQAKREK